MSVVAEIQSAIAIIRKHRRHARTGVEQFVAGQADASVTRPGGRTSHFRRYAPGTILDAFAGTEYEFPAAAIDAGRYVAVLQAELRAIASRLVMPEFMLTSDASNANYASTMVAEGPAVQDVRAAASHARRDDLGVMWRVVAGAVAAGLLPRDIREQVEIQITPPTLVARDALRDARVMQIAFEKGIVSPQTWASRLGLDYDQEMKNLKMSNAE